MYTGVGREAVPPHSTHGNTRMHTHATRTHILAHVHTRAHEHADRQTDTPCTL